MEQTRPADAFPIGSDFEKFRNAALSPAIAAQREQIEASIRSRQLIFSIAQLDYTRGILDGLLGFLEFLRLNPHRLSKVVLTLAVVPSGITDPQIERMKQEIEERVAHTNGELGTLDWVPVIYVYRSLDFESLVALYSLASVALLTPARDGMSLVAKEYLATKPDGTGVLILSEMARAAQELGEAILVNPNHHGEIAEALERALAMAPEEQVRRNRSIQERLRALARPR